MIVELFGVAALIFGGIFFVVGVIGIIRMPDIYTRLHASGKISTLGMFGILLGCAILMPSVALKILALGLFILFTGPVTTHAIAASEYRRQEIVDDLIEKQSRQGQLEIESADISGYLARSSVQDIINITKQTSDNNDT